MATNKWIYLYVVQMHTAYGWEDVTAETVITEGRARLREYRAADPMSSYKMISRREANPAHAGR